MQESQAFRDGQEPQDCLAHQDQWDHQETEVSLEKMVQWGPEVPPGHREPQALQESQGQVGNQENLEIMADLVNLA